MKSPVSFCFFAIIFLIFAMVFDARAQSDRLQNNFLLTHTLELEPSSSFKLAKSTFLPDVSDDLGALHLNFNNDLCRNYPLDFCPRGAKCSPCPFDSSKVKINQCLDPYILINGTCSCPPTLAVSYPNDVCLQYCDSVCIKKKCTPSPHQLSCTLGTEPCDNGCGKLTRNCCIKCSDVVHTKPENASFVMTNCVDGDGEHQIKSAWECNEGYYMSDNICKKNCISNTCSGYDLLECPSDKICEECTITASNCTTDGSRYKALGCRISGQIDLDSYWCNSALRCILPQP